MGPKTLVTGAAGFIGFHLARRLTEDGRSVVGVDNLNSYYDPALKRDRLDLLTATPGGFTFERLDLRDSAGVAAMFRAHRPEEVVHLAAQPGIRESVINPRESVENNVNGFLSVLEGCRESGVRHLVYASSSSVYGANTKVPFRVGDPVDHPISLYAATKRANELMAHTYSHLFGLPATGVRFFTVYGPWGRPDMAYFRFADAICKGEPVQIYGTGEALRDLTYIDDIVESLVRLLARPPQADGDRPDPGPETGAGGAPYRLFNIGFGGQISVGGLVGLLEQNLGRKAIRTHQQERPGDVFATRAEVLDLENYIGFGPQVPVEEGIARFADWYRERYKP